MQHSRAAGHSGDSRNLDRTTRPLETGLDSGGRRNDGASPRPRGFVLQSSTYVTINSKFQKEKSAIRAAPLDPALAWAIVIRMSKPASASIVSVRVSTCQRAILEAAADLAHTNVSDFVRRKALEAAEIEALGRCHPSRQRRFYGRRASRICRLIRGGR